MNRIITTDIIKAYLQCELKAYYLLLKNISKNNNDYSNMLEKEIINNRQEYIDKIKLDSNVKKYCTENVKKRVSILYDVDLTFENLTVDIDAIKTYSAENYLPIFVIGSNKITKEDKIQLAFQSYILSKYQKEKSPSGIIVSKGLKINHIRLLSLYKEIAKIIIKLNLWLEDSQQKQPYLILNKNCSFCIFEKQCNSDATKQDSLSLLHRMTEKNIVKYSKKGIFTVNQLSYVFKPRKQKRNKNVPLKYSLELQALALRERKIYIQELPKISKNKVEIYLDIEGIPDLDFYYLIGLLIVNEGEQSRYSYWANNQDEEKKIWKNFLSKTKEYPDAPIYHYGSYDSKAIHKLSERYGKNRQSDNRLINIVEFIYSKIYFPAYSNSLKELGKLLGAKWTETESTGLQSIVWRYYWNESKEKKCYDRLIAYNQEDCQALYLVVKELVSIASNHAKMTNVDFANQPKKHTTEISEQIHNNFEETLKYAHAEYDVNKIKVRKKSQKRNKTEITKDRYLRITQKPNKIIQVQSKRKCNKCFSKLKKINKDINHTLTDLVFNKNGCRKSIVKYTGKLSYCSKCKKYYRPKKIIDFQGRLFGHSFISWLIYQRVNLRLPYQILSQTANEIFNIGFSEGTIANLIRYFSKYYTSTEKLITKNILESKIIHADETKISIQGVNQYVWVFTDSENVFLKMTKTREANMVHKFLENYDGVLISDFYPGYDSVKCSQQKCWVHLIRDLNEDLWKEPFNKELELFILSVNNLIVPILQTIQKYGSKKVHLNKYQKEINKFYKKNIYNIDYTFETTKKYQKRFKRHKNSLFTFMKQDDIPWNNNMAERAIRQLAVQRKISGSFSENAAPHYLRMLSISQTCRFKNKSFLKFLISEEKDIDKFKSKKVSKYSKKIKIATPAPSKHYPRK